MATYIQKSVLPNTKDKHYTEDFKFFIYTEVWKSIFLDTITTLIPKQQWLKICGIPEGKIWFESTEI